MTETTSGPGKGPALRVDAETRLREGSPPPSRGVSTSTGALGVLHTLASAPASADDALKLLHELQVHQVELDLQHEQIEAARRELAEELDRYRSLFRFAPVGYLDVRPDGGIIEGNLAGAGLLGVRQDELAGRSIDSFLAPGSRPVILALLQEVGQGGTRAVCEVTAGGNGTAARRLRVVAGTAPGVASFLMIIEDLGPSQAA